MESPHSTNATTPNRWKRAGVFGVVTLSAWLAAWYTMRFVVADLFSIPEDATLISRDNIQSDGGEAAGEGGADAAEVANSRSLPRKQDYMRAIVQRSIFDQTGIGRNVPTTDSDTETQTDLELVLVATIIAEPSEYSSALIISQDGSSRGVYYADGGPRSEIRGHSGVQLLEIRGRTRAVMSSQLDTNGYPTLMRQGHSSPPSVLLSNNGVPETLAMTADQGYGREAPSESRSSSTSRSSSNSMVTQDGSNRFIVEQALIDQITSDPEALQGEVRVSAHRGADGETDGFRLSGIRRRSTFRQLGIRNGDIVHTVNGQSLTDANQAVEAYSSLQGVSNFTFEITRRNERQTFEYEVR